MDYTTPRSTKREARTLLGRFRGGKLAPVMAVAVKGNEGGMLSQSIVMELDPIAGRLITPVTGEFVAVFVPVQAIDAIKNPADVYAGMTDVIRDKILSGVSLFPTEPEGEISKRCGVNPRSINGSKRVNEMVRIGHNAAVNYLRTRKYDKATLLLHSNTAITPALISQTVLQRLNGVLDPDDHVNGKVHLQIPNMQLPVTGVGYDASQVSSHLFASSAGFRETGQPLAGRTARRNSFASTAANPQFEVDASGVPLIFAALNGATAGNVSLVDFYNAEKMDSLTRTMRQIVDDNPEYGEEMVLRWAHGLSIDSGRMPFVIAEKTAVFGRDIVAATDTAGISAETMRSDMMLNMSFSVPVPRTELGGIIITFAVLKPDEALASQPHPILSDVWGAENFVADEMALDPQPVNIRHLNADCLQADELTVAFYTGLNQLKTNYVHYGLNRHLNPTTVANKTSIWQLEVPMSVTPNSVLYPDILAHYPFADQAAEVCTYTISSMMVLQSPMVVGPTPVETLAIIGTSDLFDEV